MSYVFFYILKRRAGTWKALRSAARFLQAAVLLNGTDTSKKVLVRPMVLEQNFRQNVITPGL